MHLKTKITDQTLNIKIVALLLILGILVNLKSFHFIFVLGCKWSSEKYTSLSINIFGELRLHLF